MGSLKINPDCVRDVMIYLEDNLSVVEEGNQYWFGCVGLSQIYCAENIRKKYNKLDVIYVVFQLIQDGYIIAKSGKSYDQLHCNVSIGSILFITPKGHAFLSGIKDKKSWMKVKPILEKVGSISLSAIEAIANGVTTAIIGSYIHAIEL